MSVLILSCAWKWVFKLAFQTGMVMIKYILCGCVLYLLRCGPLTDREFGDVISVTTLHFPLQQDNLVGRESSAAPPRMVPLYCAL